MSLPARVSFLCISSLFLFSQAACNVVPYSTYRQSQLHAMHLHQQNLAMSGENSALQQQLADSNSQLGIANQRLDNLKNGLSRLQQHNLGLIDRLKNSKNPLGRDTTRRLQDLSGKYKNFEFDPETGVSKFHSDILFDVGSDRVKPDGLQLLQEFASIMNQGDAGKLNILVVGHTDDQRIANTSTRRIHPTNWHLSTNRANSVVLLLSKQGIRPARLGAAGYSMYQPVVANKDGRSRHLNRRVEIYVLAPDAAVAGRWNDRVRN
jgi:chemotaxis protein MotB